MAQASHTRLKFKKGNSEGTDTTNFIDLAAALSAVDRKQYHHVAEDGTALAYHFTITPVNADVAIEWSVMPNSWTTANAVKKAVAGWKNQLRHGGIRLSDLPPYARRARFAFDEDAYAHQSYDLIEQFIPQSAKDKPLFADFKAPGIQAADGTITPVDVTYGSANQPTKVPVTDASGDATDDLVFCLAGESNTAAGTRAFGVISEYLLSRRNMGAQPTQPADEFADSDGLMLQLYATAEELSDDIIDAVDDFGIFRPYDEVSAYTALTGGTASSVGAERLPISMDSVAPCGLIRVESITDGMEFYVDVHAIIEMS